MGNYLIFILIIVLIYYISDYNATRAELPLYFDLNMSKICKSLDDNKDDKDDKDVDIKKGLSACQKEKIKSCLPEKSIETQLFEQKKKVEELTLQLADNTPTYRFSKHDRYFLDNGYTGGDDKFTERMQAMSKKSKEAVIARSMWSKNSLIPYLEEELQMHENSGGWWEDQNLEIDM